METGLPGEAAFVVVGGGMAGARAASTLARASHQRVVLVCAERAQPYDRPAISKSFLRGDAADEDIALYRPGQLERLGVMPLMGQVACALDPDRRVVQLDSGHKIRYGELLVATGRQARTLDLPGADLDGVFTLRQVEQAEELRRALHRDAVVTVIGGGFIGLEVAAAARWHGASVRVVDVDPVPFGSRLGEAIGQRVREWHEQKGVEFHLENRPVELSGLRAVERVILANGGVLATSAVVVGVGSRPATEWIGSVPLAPDGTLEVDGVGRTAVPGVWACGDACSWTHPYFGRLTVEHETAAQTQGRQVAMSMAGRQSALDGVPYAWSDQYDHRLELVGVPDSTGCDVDVVGTGTRGMVAIYRRGTAVQGVATLDLPAVSTTVLQLMQRELPVDARQVSAVVRDVIDEQSATGVAAGVAGP